MFSTLPACLLGGFAMPAPVKVTYIPETVLFPLVPAAGVEPESLETSRDSSRLFEHLAGSTEHLVTPGERFATRSATGVATQLETVAECHAACESALFAWHDRALLAELNDIDERSESPGQGITSSFFRSLSTRIYLFF